MDEGVSVAVMGGAIGAVLVVMALVLVAVIVVLAIVVLRLSRKTSWKPQEAVTPTTYHNATYGTGGCKLILTWMALPRSIKQNKWDCLTCHVKVTFVSF